MERAQMEGARCNEGLLATLRTVVTQWNQTWFKSSLTNFNDLELKLKNLPDSIS